MTEYTSQRETMAERNRLASESIRSIDKYLAAAFRLVDLPRKTAAKLAFRTFCETYLGAVFCKPWSADHLKVIAKIEQAVLRGGLFAMAMPRGSGKTSLCEAAVLWALLFGLVEFVGLVGSDEDNAAKRLKSLKTELEYNDLLATDFPEICTPIRRLEGINQRRLIFNSMPVKMEFTAKQIVLPMLSGLEKWAAAQEPALDAKRLLCLGGGGIVDVSGITGGLRGPVYKRPDGRMVRPSLAIIDDPQTDESARSPQQCADREAIVAKAILGWAGPGSNLAAVMPCTVIRNGDMADTMLNRDKHPAWNGERTKMVYSFPADEKRWQVYRDIWSDSLRKHGDIREATEYYREHRAEMDMGAVVAWAERYKPDELSALQHAMNLRCRDERAFFSEYQNEPLPELGIVGELTPGEICEKLNGLERGVAPLNAHHMTAFIDVQQTVLYYTVVAFEPQFSAAVVDYGTFPDQHMPYFALSAIRNTLAAAFPGRGIEGYITAGLERLVATILGREWKMENGSTMRVERLLIDANWGETTNFIYQFCRRNTAAAIVMPGRGRYYGASSEPITQFAKRGSGDRVGLNWIVKAASSRACRDVTFDSNFWKSFVHSRLAVAIGDPGCMSFWGRDENQHRMIADHLTSEYRVRTKGRGREVDEWKIKPGRPDNHWLDCLSGCCVAASMCGVVPVGAEIAPRQKVRLSEKYKQKRAM